MLAQSTLTLIVYKLLSVFSLGTNLIMIHRTKPKPPTGVIDRRKRNMKNTLLFLAILSVCAMGLNLFGAKQSRQTPSKGKIVVFGGNGFVGSRVTRSLLDQGCSVVSISKSGSAPKWGNFEGASFVKGDPTNADDEKTIRTAARGAKAAISCIGTIGFDADRLTQGNGVANVEAVRIAKSAGKFRGV